MQPKRSISINCHWRNCEQCCLKEESTASVYSDYFRLSCCEDVDLSIYKYRPSSSWSMSRFLVTNGWILLVCRLLRENSFSWSIERNISLTVAVGNQHASAGRRATQSRPHAHWRSSDCRGSCFCWGEEDHSHAAQERRPKREHEGEKEERTQL